MRREAPSVIDTNTRLEVRNIVRDSCMTDVFTREGGSLAQRCFSSGRDVLYDHGAKPMAPYGKSDGMGCEMCPSMTPSPSLSFPSSPFPTAIRVSPFSEDGVMPSQDIQDSIPKITVDTQEQTKERNIQLDSEFMITVPSLRGPQGFPDTRHFLAHYPDRIDETTTKLYNDHAKMQMRLGGMYLTMFDIIRGDPLQLLSFLYSAQWCSAAPCVK